jgi:hypothetical protein
VWASHSEVVTTLTHSYLLSKDEEKAMNQSVVTTVEHATAVPAFLETWLTSWRAQPEDQTPWLHTYLMVGLVTAAYSTLGVIGSLPFRVRVTSNAITVRGGKYMKTILTCRLLMPSTENMFCCWWAGEDEEGNGHLLRKLQQISVRIDDLLKNISI